MAGGAGCDEMAYKVAPQCPAGHSGCVPSEPLPLGDPETTSERTPAYATSVLSLGRLSADDSALHFELVDSKHGQVIATRREPHIHVILPYVQYWQNVKVTRNSTIIIVCIQLWKIQYRAHCTLDISCDQCLI